LAGFRLNFDNETNKPHMSSIIEGYSNDIFISYRQNDNRSGWVTEFVAALQEELAVTLKEPVSVYFDLNPHDGLLEIHNVDKSLEGKLNCLIFIPIISQTYCDSKSFAWQHEFCTFNKLTKEDQFGRDIKLASGNVTSRILPIKIHELDPEDKALLEHELGGVLRSIEFIYKSAGVNRPLRANEDHPQDNLNKTYYRDQINKVANAVKELIISFKKQSQHPEEVPKQDFEVQHAHRKNLRAKIILASVIILVLIALGYFLIPTLSKPKEQLEKSIAVLPFEDMSPKKDQEYFSDGMVDAILDHLFKVGNMKVISRTSSLRYKNTKLTLKEIAQELGVSALLEGSVQKIGNKVRITAQLIDPRTSFHLWSETYDRDLSDVFLIQSEVAQNVARELKATLTAKETQLIQNAPPTTNQLAYDFYLKGNDYFSKYNFLLASDMYSKAIEKDSLFAVAYAKRAKTQLHIYWEKGEGWQGHELKALEDIKKVLHLNPELPELKFTQAVAKYYIDRNYDNALKIFKELKTETPDMADLYAYSSFILRRQGKWDESISEIKLGMQLDPFNALYIENLLETYEFSHQYNNQIECSRQGLSLLPDFKNFNVYIFSGVLNKTGDLKTSLKESGLNEEDVQYKVYYYTKQYDKLIKFKNNDTAHPIDQYYWSPKILDYALIYYLNGNKSFCKIYADSSIMFLKEKLNETPDDDRIYASLGKSYAFSGNDKDAIACGKRAVNLKPIKLDAMEGSIREQGLMEIYLFTGNYDLALDKIEYLLSIPSQLSIGKLIIDPIFDDLRSLPRFQRIINYAQKRQRDS
jgi:TolB-like protein